MKHLFTPIPSTSPNSVKDNFALLNIPLSFFRTLWIYSYLSLYYYSNISITIWTRNWQNLGSIMTHIIKLKPHAYIHPIIHIQKRCTTISHPHCTCPKEKHHQITSNIGVHQKQLVYCIFNGSIIFKHLSLTMQPIALLFLPFFFFFLWFRLLNTLKDRTLTTRLRLLWFGLQIIVIETKLA